MESMEEYFFQNLIKKEGKTFGRKELIRTFALANEKQTHSQQSDGAIAQLVRAHDS